MIRSAELSCFEMKRGIRKPVYGSPSFICSLSLKRLPSSDGEANGTSERDVLY